MAGGNGQVLFNPIQIIHPTLKNKKMKTKIYGASDDLVEIEGEISDEYCQMDFKGTVEASDGTKAKLIYDGEWKFQMLFAGSKFLKLVKSVGDDIDIDHTDEDAKGCSTYSDVLVLDSGIEWIRIGRKKFNP